MDSRLIAARLTGRDYTSGNRRRSGKCGLLPGGGEDWGLEGCWDARTEDIVSPPLRGGVPREAAGIASGGAGLGDRESRILDAR